MGNTGCYRSLSVGPRQAHGEGGWACDVVMVVVRLQLGGDWASTGRVQSGLPHMSKYAPLN